MNLRFACARLAPAVLLLLLVPTLTLHSQPQPPRFEHITVADGLSQDIVISILQDSKGFLWFGTEDGLNRYDGYSIRVFKHSLRDTTSISDNVIHSLYEDREHRLWIGTGNGLNRFDDAHESFVHFSYDSESAEGLSSRIITAIQEDSEGNLWIGTTNGLNRFEKRSGTFTRFFHNPRTPTSLNASGINRILLSRSGSLWIATTNGFCRFQPNEESFRRYLWKAGPGFSNVRQLFEDRAGTLWISVEQQGLWRLVPSGKDGRLFQVGASTARGPASKTPADAVISALEEDSRGNIWIGHFSGLDIYEPGSETFWHFLTNPDLPTAPGGRVEAVYRDRAGAMWLGTYQDGVYRYDPRKQQFSLLQPSRATGANITNAVYSVLEDRSGRIWIGTDEGLGRYDPGTGALTFYRHDGRNPASLSFTQVNAILEDRQGNLWVGGSGQTGFDLNRFDRRTGSFAHFPLKGVRTLFEDRSGTLWAGLLDEAQTGRNLVRFDRTGKIARWYRVPGSGVWNIFEDHAGTLWLGGQYCCLTRFDQHSETLVPLEAQPADTTKLSSGAVRTMAEDRDHHLWIGTWGGGLLLYDPARDQFLRFTEEDGLPSNYVKGILSDDHGNIWTATERGLSRLDPKTRAFRNFTTEDGLQGDRFLSGSLFKGRQGAMYFGGVNGLNIFHPDSIGDNPNIPSVIITNFKIFDRQVHLPQVISATKEIRLSYDQDFFSFDFVSLDYTAPRRNRYAYILEGFDRAWVQAGFRRYAAYTGVPPGTYVFRVRGSNSDGIWNDQGASIRVIVEPPFWQTWWFLLLAISTVVALLFLAYRYRVNQLLAVERLRARIASDLHDDIGTNLSTIALAGQALARVRGLKRDDRELIDRIKAVAQRTTDQMKDIVWVLKTSNDSLNDVIARMGDIARQLLAGMQVHFEAPAGSLLERVDLEFKRNIFLFFKECLNNIVQHSGATKVSIQAMQSDQTFILRIEDNGRGFDEKRTTTGSGLENLRARAEQMGGSVTISGKHGRGTLIVLSIKMTQLRHSIRNKGRLSLFE